MFAWQLHTTAQLSGVAVVHVGESVAAWRAFLAHRDQRLPVSVQVLHRACAAAPTAPKSLGDRNCTEILRQQGSPRDMIVAPPGVLTGVVRLVFPAQSNIDKQRYSLRTLQWHTVVDLTIKSPRGRLEGITGDHGRTSPGRHRMALDQRLTTAVSAAARQSS